VSRSKLSQVSVLLLIGLSAIAILTVASRYFEPPHPDEETGAHVFQLSVVGFVPVFLLFLVTCESRRPRRFLQLLAIPLTTFSIAFGALYYLEHWR